MSLSAGTKLGPYEIIGLLGAGGMGEVYRARDTRLGRDVAVKVLPRGMASDPERQQRFEAEARAAGALNHPNIVTLHDVGVAEGIPYLVTEVLEGMSLRALILQGPVTPSRAVDLIVQLAQGLSAAHAKGIIHRDLKPENLFVLSDGRLKILDFGIAKLTRTESVSEAETTPVFASLTAAGTIMGTVSYMAPEQLRDRPVDQRADLFAVGAILHELLTGKQPFTGETAADRVSAILMSNAPAIPAEAEREIPGIGAVVTHLLAKRPEGRFDTASDLAFTLTLLKGKPSPPPSPEGSTEDRPSIPALTFHQLTFRDGVIGNARFTPDGQTIVYDAAWGGGRGEVYMTRLESPESSPLGIEQAIVQAVSSTTEVAVVLRPKDIGGFIDLGTLARVPLVGGRPRELVDSVFCADWAPDGRSLAAIRVIEGACQIEAPLGRVVHTTHAWVSHLRYSPDGSMLAFLEHPSMGNNAGYVSVIKPGEAPRRLTGRYEMVWRMTWRHDGKEIWFGGQGENETSVGVLGVNLDGEVRRVFSAPGWAAVEDVARNGDVLIAMNRPRMRLETGTRGGGAASVKDLSNLDWSLLRDMSPDGSTVLFDETGLGSGGNPGVYLRHTDGSPAVRLADGVCSSISPDGRFVLTGNGNDLSAFTIVPTRAGEPMRMEVPGYTINYGTWIPGTDSILLSAAKEKGPRHLYRYELGDKSIRPITEERVGTGVSFITSDGKQAVCRDADGHLSVVDIESRSTRVVPGLGSHHIAAGWAADSRHLFVWSRGAVPARVDRVDVESGTLEPWMEIWPAARSGVEGYNSIRLTPDGERYAGCYMMIDSTLFLARGVT